MTKLYFNKNDEIIKVISLTKIDFVFI